MLHRGEGSRFDEVWPLRRSLMWIFLATLAVSGSATMGWLYVEHVRLLRKQDARYQIVSLVQTGPEKEVLKTIYLEELLGLSVDAPQNLYAFDTEEARKKLLSSPLIKEATVRLITPGTVYVDYGVRQPLAYLADYVNVAIDEEGYLFPFSPFFTPKKLPEIYLGLPAFENPVDEGGRLGGRWHHSFQGPHFRMAKHLLSLFSEKQTFAMTRLKRIDVSNAFAESYGQREVVVALEEYVERKVKDQWVLCIFPRLLRLGAHNYPQQLANYLLLRETLTRRALQPLPPPDEHAVARAQTLVVDMRLSDLAFLESVN